MKFFYLLGFLSVILNLLVSSEAKQQVLANLANFAYDPKNSEHLLQLQVPDLFLDMLTEDNEDFVEFGMGEFSQRQTVCLGETRLIAAARRVLRGAV